MGFLSNWFSKKESEDYEQILASLALDIQKRQTRLSEIRLRERRATLLATVYTFAIWGAYVALWYTQLLPNVSGRRRGKGAEKFVKTLPVIVGPIIILFTRRIVQIWYTRIGNAEEKTLKALLAQQRAKIEDIKKKTNYYTTRNLLERYDDGAGGTPSRAGNGAGTPLRQRIPPGGIPATPVQGQVTNPKPQAQGQESRQSTPQTPERPELQTHLTPTPNTLPPPRKQWYDKLADALLGDDDSSSANTATSKYALICQQCFTHNGLVQQSAWEDAQYVCPKCGHFNPSVRARKQGLSSPTPRTPAPFSPITPGPISTQHAQEKSSHAFAPPLGQPVSAPDGDTDGNARRGEAEENGDRSMSMEVDASYVNIAS